MTQREARPETAPETAVSNGPPGVSDWLTPVTAAGIAIVMAYWTAVITWPSQWDVGDVRAWRWVAGIAAVIAFGVAAAGALKYKNQFEYLAPMALIVGLGLALIAVGSGNLSLDDASRFPIAVGGTALGGLLLGIARYQTIRAAASVVAVILVIGVLTFPGGKEVVGESNVGTVVGWMAALIGVNGAAEAAVQLRGGSGRGDLPSD